MTDPRARAAVSVWAFDVAGLHRLELIHSSRQPCLRPGRGPGRIRRRRDTAPRPWPGGVGRFAGRGSLKPGRVTCSTPQDLGLVLREVDDRCRLSAAVAGVDHHIHGVAQPLPARLWSGSPTVRRLLITARRAAVRRGSHCSLGDYDRGAELTILWGKQPAGRGGRPNDQLDNDHPIMPMSARSPTRGTEARRTPIRTHLSGCERRSYVADRRFGLLAGWVMGWSPRLFW